jgi:uncharacterized protein (TIGR02646 family)
MLQLIEKSLNQAEQAELERLQRLVNDESSFLNKIQKAKSLWISKDGESGKDVFRKIKALLTEMCIGIEICNYCEGNEANDIEHIYPKSFFPDYAFVWINYLLACKQCNTGYKLDKCYVMDNSGEVHETERGKEPLHKQIAIINPRIEDPNNFLWLNTSDWEFELKDELNAFDTQKAEKTLIILGLNTRPYLIEQRRYAHNHYYDKMERLARILNASNIASIEATLAPADDLVLGRFDKNLSINEIKSIMKESVKQYIQKHSHPSVWYAIKTISSKTNNKWKFIFEQIPEALRW